ncbi:hypothetical protein ASE75_14760 [Sphingomonas sp. Leaf17]|nr:hypothetical protein ASE75_14760 [Sphingomonas sp. Leaf17]
MAAAGLPLLLVVGLNTKCYSFSEISNGYKSASRIFWAVILIFSLILFISLYMRANMNLSRAVFGLGSIFALVILIASRFAFASFVHRLRGGPPVSEVVILEGASWPRRGNAFVINAEQAGLIPDVNDPDMLDRIGRTLRNADRVIVVCEEARRAQWAFVLKGISVKGEILAPEIEKLGPLGTSHFDDAQTVVVSIGRLSLHNRILKRALDLTVAMIAFLLLLIPFVIIAVAIKLDSPGSVFFRQVRIGENNRHFRVIKFRSMRTDRLDHNASRLTARDDDRVTRVGRFIRKTSIDELPQVINVLRGEMSIVGPRPHALGALAGESLYWEVDARYWHRHAVKPGITGLAQVRGFRGSTFQRSDLADRLQADLEYIESWTIWRDIAIILATFHVIAKRDAAF